MTQLTIGLPVYNGARDLARSLEHLLAQTHRDFVLIISDNASTDATAEICADFMKRDSRIRYYRQPNNLVWNENFRFVLMKAETPYFMWATHDDIWLPRFAEANVARLEADPSAVCSVSKIVYFTREGERNLAPDTGALSGPPAERIKRFFSLINNCGRFYGVYRTQALQASFPADLHVYATDWLVVALTLLHGDHLEVDDVLLEREAQPFGHYVRAIGRVDRFEPDWRDQIIPLRRFNAELQKRLPVTVWKRIWPSLLYINLRQTGLALEQQLPALRPGIRLLRSMAANVFHRRWRARRIV